MARVNHKLVKQRLNEKRSKITDKQFFSSRMLAGHFEDTGSSADTDGTITTAVSV